MKMARVSGERAQRWASNSIPVMLSIQISRTATGTAWRGEMGKEDLRLAKGFDLKAARLEKASDRLADG